MIDNLEEAFTELRSLKQEAARLDREAKDKRKEHDRLERDILDTLKERRLGSIKFDDTNFVPAKTIYAKVENRDEFVEWAKIHDEGLIETKERKGDLNKLVRQYIDDGEPLPPGLGFYEDEYISQRAA